MTFARSYRKMGGRRSGSTARRMLKLSTEEQRIRANDEVAAEEFKASVIKPLLFTMTGF